MRTFLLIVVAIAAVTGCRQNGGKDQVWDLRSNTTLPPPTMPRAQDSAAAPAPNAAASARPVCKVRFRRDAIGVNGSTMIPLLGDGAPGFPVTLSGTLVECTPHWITLDAGNRHYVIPWSSILMIEQNP